ALAVALGASRVGVIFAGGPRQVSEGQAREVVAAAGPVPVFGVFGSDPMGSILGRKAAAGLGGAQVARAHQQSDFEAALRSGVITWAVWHPGVGEDHLSGLEELAAAVQGVVIEPQGLVRTQLHHAHLPFAEVSALRPALGRAALVLAGGLTPE